MAKRITLLMGRQILAKVASSATSFKSGMRQIHAFRPNEVHASGYRRYRNDYIHAETMYNLTAMYNRKVKFGALVWDGVFSGIFIPLIACSFQQRKAKGG